MPRVPRPKSPPAWHRAFMLMLPKIRLHARVCFRHLDPEAKQEAIQEVVCNALRAYVRLVELKKADLAYPTVLASYGVRQVKDGRRVGGHMNVQDVSSRYCQQKKNITVERLDRFDTEENAWEEILIEDRTAGPAEIAASRLDFPAWLGTLSRRNRKIAMKLAEGERPGRVARKFCLSAGRISQLRREMADSWRAFVGEPPLPQPAAA